MPNTKIKSVRKKIIMPKVKSSSPASEAVGLKRRCELQLVSLILVNWNSRKYLEPLLESLKKQSYKNIEMLLFDNGSSDGSLEYIRQNYPRIKITQSEENQGFARPLNICIARSKGKYILVANMDTFFEPHFIEEMVKAIEIAPDIGSVAGKIFKIKAGKKTQEPDCFSHFIRKDRTVVHLSVKEPDYQSSFYKEGRYCFGTPASAALYKREMLEDIKVNGEIFDENFFAYWEDVDVDWRSALRGWKCYYNPQAIAYHVREGSGLKKSDSKIAADCLANKFLTIIKNDSIRYVITDLHLIFLKACVEWLDYARRNIIIPLIALWKIFRLTPRMFRKRKVIQRRKKVDHKYIRVWFEDLYLRRRLRFTARKPYSFFKRIKHLLQSSATYRELGLLPTLAYSLVALILFFIGKIATVLIVKPLTIFAKQSINNPTRKRRKTVSGKRALLIPVIPDISHHFIYREVEELLTRGNYEVITLVRGDPRYRCKSLEPLLGKIIYLESVSDVRLLGLFSYLYYLLKSPISVARLINYYRIHEKEPLTLSVFYDPYNPIRGFALARYLQRRGISYVHVFGSTNPATRMLVAHLFLNIPFSITAYVDFDYPYSFKMLEEKVAHSEFCVVTTKFCKKRLGNYLNGHYCDKIYIIQSALDLERFIPQRVKTANVLAVGRLVEKKGFSYLIEACRILKKDGLKFKCTIVGGGPLEKALKSEIWDKQLEDIITLTGGITVDEVRDYYQRSTILVHPGIIASNGDRDGIPNSVSEAMAMGVPVIASAISGTPELITNEKTGLLVPAKDSTALADAMRRLIIDKGLRSRLAKRGRKRVEEFANIKNTVNNLHSLLEKHRGTL